MKLSPHLLQKTKADSDVLIGNIYPAKGGKGDTEYWLVVALSTNGAHLIGFNADGNVSSTSSYLRGALRERPVIGRADVSALVLEELK